MSQDSSSGIETEKMVGAIGFQPTPTQHYVVLAGLGWQPKHRKGSQRNICWTRFGHGCWLSTINFLELILAHNAELTNEQPRGLLP